MSETRQVMCDRCGSVVIEGLTRLTVETGPTRKAAPLIDLCPSCGERFADFMKAREPALAGRGLA